MKKAVLILVIVTFIAVIVMTTLTLTGCKNYVTSEQLQESDDLIDRFFTIEGYDGGLSIVVDRETGVCYLREIHGTSRDRRGYMTALLHADGTPILYVDGEMK